MFKLKLDIAEADDDISKITPNFLETLPKELQKIVKDIKGKSKKNCPKLKSTASGAFGSIEISKDKVKKVLGLIQPQHHKTLLTGHKVMGKKSQLYFLINRLNNYCKDINSFVKSVRKIFPNNFLKIYKCNLCQGSTNTPDVYVEMALGKGKTLSDILKQKSLSKKELESIFIQIYYISMVLNMKKLFHNDLKPANIIIAKSDKSIIYEGLKNNKGDAISMKLPKGNYYPIIVDYDLISKQTSQTVESPGFISPGSPDFSFFSATVEKIDVSQEKVLSKLPEFNDINDIKKSIRGIYDAMKKYNKVLTINYKGNQEGGAFPLIAARAASMFLKNPAARKMAMNVVKNPALRKQVMSQGQRFIKQNPQVLAQAQQMGQQFLQQQPQVQQMMQQPQQMQQQLNQRFQQMQQQPQYQQMRQMVPQQYAGGKKQKGRLLKKLFPVKYDNIIKEGLKEQKKQLKKEKDDKIKALTDRRNKMRQIEKKNGPRTQQLTRMLQQLKM